MHKLLSIYYVLIALGCSDSSKENAQTESESIVVEPYTPTVPESDLQVQASSELEATDSIEAANWRFYEESMKIENYISDSNITEDVLIIDTTVLVLVGPTEEQMDEMINELGDDFYTVADDNNYYEYEAKEFMKAQGIMTIYPKTRYIEFIGTNSEKILVDTKSKFSRGWTAFLFAPDKRPKIVSITDISFEFEDYFN